MFTPGLRGCGYKTVSGRHEWPNHDPIGELGGLNLYGYVRNDPVNAIDPLGLIDCAALKATLENLFSNFQRDSNLQRQFLNGQYNALGNLFVYNEAVDAGTTVAGAGLAEGLNAARVALTSETVGQGTSLAVDVARSGSLTGPGISSATSYLTPGIGGAIGGPLAAHGLGDTAGYISGELGQNYTSEGVQEQLQATIDELNAELNQQLANIQNLMNEYNAACPCH